MPSPPDCRYSSSHEWFRVDDDVVTIGITQFAANELTDITYAEMRPVGTEIEPSGAIGEVESVKTTSEVYSVVGGEIVEVNEALATDPGLVNSDPFGDGWLVRVRTSDTAPLDGLMDQETYDERHPLE